MAGGGAAGYRLPAAGFEAAGPESRRRPGSDGDTIGPMNDAEPNAPVKPEDPDIEAAGGLVSRREDGENQVVVIHRPKYDDWSFPKGKLDPGETFTVAALREVEEETGLRCRLGPELPSIRYRDQQGRSKVVRYWLMNLEKGSIDHHEPDDEVDLVRWVSLDEARELLSYEHDRELLEYLHGTSPSGSR